MLKTDTFYPSGSNPKIDSFGGQEFGLQLIEAHVALGPVGAVDRTL